MRSADDLDDAIQNYGDKVRRYFVNMTIFKTLVMYKEHYFNFHSPHCRACRIIVSENLRETFKPR